MSHAYQIHKQDAAYYLTITAVEWADAFMLREDKQPLSSIQEWHYSNHAMEVFSPKFTLSKFFYIYNNHWNQGWLESQKIIYLAAHKIIPDKKG